MEKTRLRISVIGVFRNNHQILVLHQMTFPEPDKWDLPGGGLHPEESLMEGLKREIFEETGIQDFRVEKLLTIVEGFWNKSPEDRIHALNLIYECTLTQTVDRFTIDPIEVGEKGIQWMNMDDLNPDECTTRLNEVLRILKQE